MAAIDDRAIWSCLIKSIWARRLAGLAARDGAEPRLTAAWSSAIAEAWAHHWDLDGIVPLRRDEHGHEWAVVVSRTRPTADMILIHGTTPLEALERTSLRLAEIR